MDMKKHVEEIIRETIEELGEKLSDKCIKEIVENVAITYQNSSLIYGDPQRSIYSREEEIRKELEKKYADEINLLRYEVDSFRRSVAERRGVNEFDVKIENGKVIYYK